MASYRYLRDIKPEDLQPEAEHVPTKAEAAKNWWYYHWKFVLAGIAGAAVIFWFAHDIVLGYQSQPDTSIALVGSGLLDNQKSSVQSLFTPLITDVNGDGRVIFSLNSYEIDFSAAGQAALDQNISDSAVSSAASASVAASSGSPEDSIASDFSGAIDPYAQMAADTRLMSDFQEITSGIFLVSDPAGFENYTGSLRYLDGTNADVDDNNVSPSDWYRMVYRVSDCPALVALLSQDETGGGQILIDNFYIGFRNCYDEKSAAALADDEVLWATLTEGAVSTVEADS